MKEITEKITIALPFHFEFLNLQILFIVLCWLEFIEYEIKFWGIVNATFWLKEVSCRKFCDISKSHLKLSENVVTWWKSRYFMIEQEAKEIDPNFTIIDNWNQNDSRKYHNTFLRNIVTLFMPHTNSLNDILIRRLFTARLLEIHDSSSFEGKNLSISNIFPS